MATVREQKIREAFSHFESEGRVAILECGGEDLKLKVNGHTLSVIDPLEGSPLVMAVDDGPAAAATLAERVNERLERMGGASFSALLDVLLSASGKRPAPTPTTVFS